MPHPKTLSVATENTNKQDAIFKNFGKQSHRRTKGGVYAEKSVILKLPVEKIKNPSPKQRIVGY